MRKLPLSVFIIARNEADRIAQPIISVRDWADEIIVIDSGSSDDTLAVSQALGAQTCYNPWTGYGPQKNFGEEQCRNQWLLNLDADEEITPELAAEIQALFAHGEPPLAGYSLRIRDLLPGETRLAWLAHTNYAVRLYNRQYARFSDSPVHDTVQVAEGSTQLLAHPVLHRSFRSLRHTLEKMNFYTGMQAETLARKNMRWPHLRLLTEFPLAFCKGYFLRGYALRGWRGFIYAVVYAFSRFVRVAKVLEMSSRHGPGS